MLLPSVVRQGVFVVETQDSVPHSHPAQVNRGCLKVESFGSLRRVLVRSTPASGIVQREVPYWYYQVRAWVLYY